MPRVTNENYFSDLSRWSQFAINSDWERGGGEKKNDLRDSVGNRSESGTQDSDHHDKNKASYKGSG